MNVNTGLLKEKNLVLAINGKKFKDLTNNCKYIVENIFDHVDYEDVVNCSLVDGFIKPDIKISINDAVHYLSMKSGGNTIVHQENVQQLADVLRQEGISEETVNTILLFHYGDGTTDGTGKVRYDYSDTFYYLKDRIRRANRELNENRRFVVTMVYRFIFKGTNKDNIAADFLYHGDKEYGIIASREQILEYMFRENWFYYDNLHIGPLTLKPHARYVNSEIKNPRRRETIEVHWPNMAGKIHYIASRFNGIKMR